MASWRRVYGFHNSATCRSRGLYGAPSDYRERIVGGVVRRRIQTIQHLVRLCFAGRPELPILVDELAEVLRINSHQPLRRRCLVQVLFSTRAVDTGLLTFLQVRGIPVGQRSIGGYLTQLASHHVPGVGRLSQVERQRYQSRIAAPRNRYLHQAGANPAGIQEVRTLLNEMYSCLARVFTL